MEDENNTNCLNQEREKLYLELVKKRRTNIKRYIREAMDAGRSKYQVRGRWGGR